MNEDQQRRYPDVFSFPERTEADPWLVKMPAYTSRAQVKRLQGEIE